MANIQLGSNTQELASYLMERAGSEFAVEYVNIPQWTLTGDPEVDTWTVTLQRVGTPLVVLSNAWNAYDRRLLGDPVALHWYPAGASRITTVVADGGTAGDTYEVSLLVFGYQSHQG